MPKLVRELPVPEEVVFWIAFETRDRAESNLKKTIYW
jgi:hypothetical protein